MKKQRGKTCDQEAADRTLISSIHGTSRIDHIKCCAANQTAAGKKTNQLPSSEIKTATLSKVSQFSIN